MPPFFMAITLNLKGTSATPADTVAIPEWEPTTAIRDAKGQQPGSQQSGANAFQVTSPPADDDNPGKGMTRNQRVSAITMTWYGTSGATAKNNLATTTNGKGTGLTVNLAAIGGVVTAITVGNNAGLGYELGDTIAVSTALTGTAAPVTGNVTWVLQ